MQKINIREPKWQPVPSVGISDRYADDLEITISHKRADGTRMFPATYIISKDRLLAYPLLRFKDNMPMVRMIPISMLEIKI